MGIIESIFGSHSDHELKRINPLVDKVMSYEEEFSKLSDHDLAGKTAEFKNKVMVYIKNQAMCILVLA